MDFPIKSISDLERLSYAVKWQYFEKLVAFIFEQNGFHAEQNVIIKDSEIKRQLDVVAKRYGATYLVECKKWKGRQRVSAIKTAVKRHMERCQLYEQLHSPCRPIIVTLLDDSVEADIPVVPIMKLNAFLNDL